MSHAFIAAALQIVVGLTLRRWLIGGVFAVFFYIGREITQAEYRWISQFGDGQRANLPWWGAVDPAVWNAKSTFDIILPAIAIILIYLLEQYFRAR